MFRPALLAFLLAATAFADDVFKPPVLIGVQGDGSGRRSDKPIDFPDPKQQWVRVVTPHFVVISAAGERRTRDIAQNVETLAAALAALHPRFQQTSPVQTRMLIFGRRREAQPYFDLLLNRRNANVSGLFVAQKNGGTMLIDDSRDWRADRTPYHELIHDLLANSEGRMPLWLEEGLAEYFSNAEVWKGQIKAGTPVREHLELLRRRTPMPLAQLFAIRRESDAYNLPSGQSLFYAQSWAAVNWLMQTDRNRFDEFLQDLESGVDPAVALEARYHRSLRDMESALGGAAAERSFRTVAKVPYRDVPLAFEKLDRAELLYQLGRFLEGVDENYGEAQRHYAGALAANPKHGRTLAALGRYEEAIAATPDDPEVHLIYAESLLGHAIGRLAETQEPPADAPERFRKARTLVERAIALGAHDGRAYGDLGTTYLAEKELAPGIAALEKARALAPSRNDFALHLFAMYRRTGQREKADALFAQLDRARDEQVAYAARAIVVRVELDRANELTKQQKLGEAAAIVRELAALTKDASAKRDLERQAADIDRVAATNREIDTYNQAIGLTNAGKYREARKTIAALLAIAKDPEIIRDAQKLQKELAKVK